MPPILMSQLHDMDAKVKSSSLGSWYLARSMVEMGKEYVQKNLFKEGISTVKLAVGVLQGKHSLLSYPSFFQCLLHRLRCEKRTD